MATAAQPQKVQIKEAHLPLEGKDKAGKIVKARCAPAASAGQRHACAASSSSPKVHKQRIGAGGQVSDKDVTLSPVTGDHDEGRRAAAAVVRQSSARGTPTRPSQAADEHQDGRRDRTSALASAFRKFPLHFDALFCNLCPRHGVAGRYSRVAASTAWRRTRKRSSHQVEDQGGAVLSGRDHRRRLRHHRGHP